MFIRKTRKKNKATGKEYLCYQLVESIRTERGPRQRILLNFNNKITLNDQERRDLANRIDEILSGARSFFTIPDHLEELAQQVAAELITSSSFVESIKQSKPTQPNYQSIDINTVQLERPRTVGVEHLSLETFRKLGLDRKLKGLGFSEKQVALAAGIVIGRLAGCCSDLATHNWLQKNSALGELMGIDFNHYSHNSTYQIADALLAHKDAIEAHLAETEKGLFSFDNTVFLYDLTNTYFEGALKGASRAQKGRSKEKRSDCPLVTLGLLVNHLGFPIRSDVHDGNIAECSTFSDVIQRMTRGTIQKPVVVIDAGIATEDNLRWLREGNYKYIVCSRQRDRNPPADLQFEIVRERNNNVVEAAALGEVASREINLYCRSKMRRESELIWLKETRIKFEAALEKLKSGLNKKGHTKGLQTVMQSIGRLKERYKRLSTYYTIKIVPDDQNKNVKDIIWKFSEEEASIHFQGAYRLRAYGLSWTSKQLWETYVMLTEIEEAFRCLKSHLGLRPIYHQKDERIDAHLNTAVLSYHILRTITYQLEQEKIYLSWPTIRNNMNTQTRVTVTMKTQDDKTVHIRKSTSPELFHKQIYKALKIVQEPGSVVKTVI